MSWRTCIKIRNIEHLQWEREKTTSLVSCKANSQALTNLLITRKAESHSLPRPDSSRQSGGRVGAARSLARGIDSALASANLLSTSSDDEVDDELEGVDEAIRQEDAQVHEE